MHSDTKAPITQPNIFNTFLINRKAIKKPFISNHYRSGS